MKKDKLILPVCLFAFAVNICLFGVKLYIGLTTNSISIYSDAVNNLFDSLSGVITFACMFLILRSADRSQRLTVKKTEQLFSFLMSIIVLFAGAYFAYNSLERFIYPTPISFTYLYEFILIGTAAVKMFMFFFYRRFSAKTQSPVIRVMAFDSILDFFITSLTVLSLVLSQKGSFAFDAVFGLIISGIIIVSAVRLIISSGRTLIDFVPGESRRKVLSALADYPDCDVFFLSEDDLSTCYITVSPGTPAEEISLLKKRISEKTDMNIIIISDTEKGDGD